MRAAACFGANSMWWTGDNGPLNLAAAINVVLYDRVAKTDGNGDHGTRAAERKTL